MIEVIHFHSRIDDDPLRVRPVTKHQPLHRLHTFPENGRPLTKVRLRAESFGYAVLGPGQVIPVRTEAKEVIDACDGNASFRELQSRFGQPGLDLLGELWDAGMIDIH